jgi:hypothetical protein
MIAVIAYMVFAWQGNQLPKPIAGVEPRVWVCFGKYAKHYHRKQCDGVTKFCKGRVEQLTLTDARGRLHRKPCPRCKP